MDDIDFNKRLAEEMSALGYSDAALFAKEAMRAVFRLADARYQRADVTESAPARLSDDAETCAATDIMSNGPGRQDRACGMTAEVLVKGRPLCPECSGLSDAQIAALPVESEKGESAPSPAPLGSAARSDATFGWEPKVYAPAPDDATEEAERIVARLYRCVPEAVAGSPSVMEFAAALRRRSGVRIGTGRIARTLLHTSPNGCKWYGERHSDGTIGLSWQAGTQSAGIGVPPDAFRATVALMARDGEGK